MATTIATLAVTDAGQIRTADCVKTIAAQTTVGGSKTNSTHGTSDADGTTKKAVIVGNAKAIAKHAPMTTRALSAKVKDF
jgi:hypothetical protein